jgi:hypothetical protein
VARPTPIDAPATTATRPSMLCDITLLSVLRVNLTKYADQDASAAHLFLAICADIVLP